MRNDPTNLFRFLGKTESIFRYPADSAVEETAEPQEITLTKLPTNTKMKHKLLCSIGIATLIGAPLVATAAAPVGNSNITIEEVEAAQKAWGAALIKISSDFKSGGIEKARKTATEVLDGAYGYASGPVLFKPTLTQTPQTFRPTKEGALAYFVGGDPKFPNDSGFALKGWTKYEFENAAVHITGDLALTTGKVRLTNADGKVTEVDKTWGFKRGDCGTVRIVLHHSSLPYQP